MQKIYDPTLWMRVEEQSGIAFASKKNRLVKLQVNAPEKTALYYLPYSQYGEPLEPVFLALVEGRDAVEFVANGPFELTVEGAPVYIWTDEGRIDTHATVIDPVIFTKIAERRRRDPEAEYMAYLAKVNFEARIAQVTNEIERRFANLPQSAPVSGGGEQAPAGGSTPPSDPPSSGEGEGSGANE